MMGHQEISHPQVLSYLVGGGDHYKSEEFKALHWGSFSRLVGRILKETEGDSEAAAVDRSDNTRAFPDGASGSSVDTEGLATVQPSDEVVVLSIGNGAITGSNQQLDYMFRPATREMDSMCVYEFTELVYKVPLRASTIWGGRDEDWEESDESFSSRAHPQYLTHTVRRRASSVIPMILGPAIPRPDRGDEEKQRWARAMLILFKPWHEPEDLKQECETWEFEAQIPCQYIKVIKYIHVFSECKDAQVRSAEQFLQELEEDGAQDHGDTDLGGVQLACEQAEEDPYEAFHNSETGQSDADIDPAHVELDGRCIILLDKCLRGLSSLSPDKEVPESSRSAKHPCNNSSLREDYGDVEEYRLLMTMLPGKGVPTSRLSGICGLQFGI